MTYSRTVRRRWPVGHRADAATSSPPLRHSTPTIACDVSWLNADGTVGTSNIMAPALPMIEAACGNVARGTLISTSDGPIAVEDLTPGTRILTSEYGPLPLQWVGSTLHLPNDAPGQEGNKLFRVTADAFGLAKPSADLMLAPRSHILMRHAACRELFGVDLAFAPIRAFEDGLQVVAITPISGIQLYNLAFDRQATIIANGVELESFHPGPFAETLLDKDLLGSLLRLFPQAREMADFGPQLTQRLTSFEVRTLRNGA